jgi:hypothetical protein
MAEPYDINRKTKTRKIVIATSVTILVFAIAMLIAYFAIEGRLFKMLSAQPGVSVKFAAKSGNLFSGYTLTGLSVHQNATGDTPASDFTTPKMAIHWKLRPMMLTGISWDDAKSKIEPSGKQPEEFPISGAVFSLSSDPSQRGWLVPEKPIVVGPESWNGEADISLRADGQQIRGKIHIAHLPMSYVTLATEIPSGFTPAGDVVLDIDIAGSLQAPQVSGTVSDPATFKAFHF